MIASETVLFAIRGALKLGMQARAAYVDATRRRALVLPILDFQFTSTVAHYLDGPDIGRHFATVFTLTNWVSLVVQLFLTSFIMTRFGLTAALMVLPFAIVMFSMCFAVVKGLVDHWKKHGYRFGTHRAGGSS